jgi:hypothetical protein
MLKINILPKYLKDDIKLRAIYLMIKNLLYIVVIFIILNTIILLLAKLILQINFVKTISETTMLTKNTENNSKNIAGINKEMNYIQKIQDNAVEWTGLYQFLEKNMPAGIKFSTISVSSQDNKIRLGGNSATRDDLIKFKDFLEKSEIFTEINFPIKNFLEKYNINFEVSATIKSYEFK